MKGVTDYIMKGVTEGCFVEEYWELIEWYSQKSHLLNSYILRL